MDMKSVLMVISAFLIGLVSALSLTYIFEPEPSVTTMTFRVPENTDSASNIVARIIGTENEELPSPYDWITEDKIGVYRDRVTIDIQNAEWARFTDTNSMDPVIDNGANAIEIRPKSEADIHIGDIVSYKSRYSDGIIIHRVIETGYDKDGWYAMFKGDNNDNVDPGKVRFSQIQRIVVAIIY